MFDEPSKLKSFLLSYGLATAVLMVGLYPGWFDTCSAEQLVADEWCGYYLIPTLIKIIVWLIFLVGFFAITVLGLGGAAIMWVADELDYEDDIEKINTFLDQYNEIKPKMWYSIPLTLYWLTAFVLANKATGEWGVTGGTYLVFSILTWLVIFGFAKGMNKLADTLREEYDASKISKK